MLYQQQKLQKERQDRQAAINASYHQGAQDQLQLPAYTQTQQQPLVPAQPQPQPVQQRPYHIFRGYYWVAVDPIEGNHLKLTEVCRRLSQSRPN